MTVIHCFFFFFLMIRRPPRSTLSSSSAASDVYKRQYQRRVRGRPITVAMAAKVDYEHRILAPTEYSLVEKRVLIDEVGRARDPGTGAIVNIGRRERIPLADEVQYNRQVALKEDYLQECKELRAQMSGLKAKLAASERRVAEYESSHSSYLEEISYLRNLTGVIYEKHRIDAYHNLGLGMKTQRLEAEVHNLRSQHERISSNLPVIENVEEVDTSQATRDAERIAGLEELVGDQDAEILKLQAPVSYTHLRAHETPEHLVCRLLLEKKKKKT
eukprot:TRINITY_DN21027_c0_g2_i2.p1 TRINITY_DN21027_c0_g2~~TRINITY_DN21027_c0_g2_i2.p1  ORF type:complete len:273 (+),score=102.64 TRINITY_DN21027_c0_g2_i2:109-927(+)